MNTHHRFARLLAPVLALALALAATACSSSPTQNTSAPTSTPAPARETTNATKGSAALRLHGPAIAHAEPDEGAAAVTELAARTELGSVTTLLVLDVREGWYRVLLPIRPNGTAGWVRADAGELRSTNHRIEVDLNARSLTVFDGDAPVLVSDIAVGAPDTPTPTGHSSVTDLVDTGEPGGPYGPFAIGLALHSAQLTEFAGGDGQVGIHGTNQPDSIGAAVSHGCVRLPNDVVAQLVELVPLGTPVLVR